MEPTEIRDALRQINEGKASPAAIDRGLEIVQKMTARNDHTGALVWFVRAFAPRDKKLMAAVAGLQSIERLFGFLPPGMGELREAVWRVASGMAMHQMDQADFARVKQALNLKV